MRRNFSQLSMITSSVEKIFIIIINKIRLVKPLMDGFSSYYILNIFFKNFPPRCSAIKNYPHQNVDFVDNL
jgi:hypothetical protein